MNSFGVEKGTTIRQPSTANLMLDSDDRRELTYPSAWNFQIAKNNSIMNGFFSRIGTTEVVLEWCEDNITTDASGDIFRVDISGTGVNTYVGAQAVNIVQSPLPGGKFTVAEALDAICGRMNLISGTTGATFSVSTTAVPGQVVIDVSGAVVTVYRNGYPLAERLDLAQTAAITGTIFVLCPDLRPYRYIDFVSDQLTYNQDLKDNSTAPITRDVLCRWYFSEDQLPQLDKYGFPILMGYTRFCYRRIYNPPKQIKWDTSQPLGNLSFQVYGDDGNLLPASDANTNWLMTLQFSEN